MNQTEKFFVNTHRVIELDDVELEDDAALQVIQSVIGWVALGAIAVTVALMAWKGWLPDGVTP